VVIAKWLSTEPQVLIMDEPTAGVDVGTKGEILAYVRQLADAGKGIILISSELPDILAVCDRILVLHRGQITQEILRGDLGQRDGVTGVGENAAAEEKLQHVIQGV